MIGIDNRGQFPKTEVLGFEDQLKEIQATMVNGDFVGSDGTIPENQQKLKDLLERCLLWVKIVLER